MKRLLRLISSRLIRLSRKSSARPRTKKKPSDSDFRPERIVVPAVRFVVGLGNPGLKYARTRHNIGFRVVDRLAASDPGASWIERDFFSESTFHFGGEKFHLVKPLTYMNRSGQAVAALLEQHRTGICDVLVVVDDIDLPLGRLRLRARGGPGTHNGLRDICSLLGREFPRLRVGVKSDESWADLADFVLSPFTSEEERAAAEIIERAAKVVEDVLENGAQMAMGRANRVNS